MSIGMQQPLLPGWASYDHTYTLSLIVATRYWSIYHHETSTLPHIWLGAHAPNQQKQQQQQ